MRTREEINARQREWRANLSQEVRDEINRKGYLCHKKRRQNPATRAQVLANDRKYTLRMNEQQKAWKKVTDKIANRRYYLTNKEKVLARTVSRRIKNGHMVRQYKIDHGCMDCGITDWEVLEFDHRDPSQKEFTIGSGRGDYGEKKLRREMAKCDVVCANHHRRRTAKQFNWGGRHEVG